jgi:UDP-N-acetylglucosamine 2-epimerase
VIEGLELQTVFPVHPRTKKMLIDNSIHVPENIKLREPCGYLESISLQKYSKFVITDSGGVQKEAYILKKPCFTYRPETEWEETVISGWNLLINPSFSADDIRSTIIDFKMPTSHENLFGADVAKNMVQLITNLLNLD